MHWLVLFVLCIVTVGVFGIFWAFIQASWVRKIDPGSEANQWLVASIGCVVFAWLAQIAVRAMDMQQGATGLLSLGSLGIALVVATIVFIYLAYFDMAASMRKNLPAYGLVPKIGGITLFIGTLLYLQGQMRWVARWKATGETRPGAPRAPFWFLLLILPVGAITAYAYFIALMYSEMGRR